MSKICCPRCATVLVGTNNGFRCPNCGEEWTDEEVMPTHEKPRDRKAWQSPTVEQPKYVQTSFLKDDDSGA